MHVCVCVCVCVVHGLVGFLAAAHARAHSLANPGHGRALCAELREVSNTRPMLQRKVKDLSLSE